MTTNLNAVAGPSKFTEIVKSEPPSPEDFNYQQQIRNVNPTTNSRTEGTGLSGESGPSGNLGGTDVDAAGKGGNLDENGEVIKVPAFLQKLYSMVSDPTTDELIHWADAGNSFFVPNHERFGKELLPRFFKHANFSSFVRQLNMYGFHKVPHLQSGVLKNDTPSELWEFVNPFFKRDQQHLLCRVTRKNNRPGAIPPQNPTSSSGNRTVPRPAGSSQTALNGQHYPMHLLTDGTIDGEAGLLVGPTAGQMIDLSAITSGIAAIQRTQAAIGADLKALQSSNEHLWREALESRETQRNHRETIDLIVGFLERLFGKEGEGVKGLAEALRRGTGMGRREDGDDAGVGGKRKRRRLGLDRMIGDGVVGGEGDVVDDDGIWDGEDDLVEISSDPKLNDAFKFFPPIPPRLSRPKSRPNLPTQSNTTPEWSASSQRFTALPTEDEPNSTNNSPFTATTSGEGSAGLQQGRDQTLAAGGISPLSDNGLLPGLNNTVAPYNQYNPSNAFNNGLNDSQQQSLGSNQNQFGAQQSNNGMPSGNPPLSPTSSAAAASAFNLDPSILQTTIGSLLQSPAAAQMFLNSLNASAQGQALANGNPSPFKTQTNPNQSSFTQPSTSTSMNGIDQNLFPFTDYNQPQDPQQALFEPLHNQNQLINQQNDLLRTYQNADNINGDVDKLQESIDSLVRSMGLDLPGGTGEQGNVDFDTGVGTDGMGGLGEDFNVEEFLESLNKANDGLGNGDGGHVGDIGNSL